MNWKTAVRFLIALAICYLIIQDGSVFTAVAVFLLFLRQEAIVLTLRAIGKTGVVTAADVEAAADEAGWL